jgi:hypothetical protein
MQQHFLVRTVTKIIANKLPELSVGKAPAFRGFAQPPMAFALAQAEKIAQKMMDRA